MGKASLTLDQTGKRELFMYAETLAKKYAHKAADMMTKKYSDIMHAFYTEKLFRDGTSSTPKYYNRTENLMNTSFKKYYVNLGRGYYRGGVVIDSGMMGNVGYSGTNEQVLSSALAGFHGAPSLGIQGEIRPQEMIDEYRKDLVDELYYSLSNDFTGFYNTR